MAAPKVYEDRKKILIVMDASMIKDIEKYWHEKGLPNRNEAIKELVKIGLEKEQPE